MQPATWWLLGFGLAFASTLSSSPIILLSIITTCTVIILLARDEVAPWSKSIGFYLALASAVVLLRLAFRIIFNYSSSQNDVLFELPQLSLNLGFGSPVSLFGAVSKTAMLAGLTDGLRLAALIVSIGLANSLANPRKLLKSTPAALYEVATAISVAINLAPQLIESLQRVRRARTLRGRSRGLGALTGTIIPALEDTIDKSLSLAASMDSRGFGRRGNMSKWEMRLARTASLLAISLSIIGSYLLLTTGGPPLLAITVIGLGISSLAFAVHLTSKRNNRTRYKKPSWALQDFVIAGFAAAASVAAFSGWWF